jgi:hypothetical protein
MFPILTSETSGKRLANRDYNPICKKILTKSSGVYIFNLDQPNAVVDFRVCQIMVFLALRETCEHVSPVMAGFVQI